ncbi:MAG: hypothetical protein ACK56F_23090, partial [bacterium]
GGSCGGRPGGGAGSLGLGGLRLAGAGSRRGLDIVPRGVPLVEVLDHRVGDVFAIPMPGDRLQHGAGQLVRVLDRLIELVGIEHHRIAVGLGELVERLLHHLE